MDVTVNGLRAVYARPPGRGPYPAVIVLHEVWGLNADIRLITDRFRRLGYSALAPDLYSGGFRPFRFAETMRDALHASGRTVERIDETRSWLCDRPEVYRRRIGIIGSGMSGRLVVAAAARSDYAVASINDGDIRENDPGLDCICPVVASYGGRDRRFLTAAERLGQSLRCRGIPHDIEVYPDATPGVIHQSLPGITRRAASGCRPETATHVWGRIERFFAEHL